MLRLHRPVAMTRVPRVSVVVPCYKYGHYLPGLIAALADQSGVEVDVLIVDDASPDDSGAMADELAARHDWVRVLHNDPNRGHIATYNRGLAAVDGDYIILLSADDLLPPDAITRAVALMEAHPRVGLVYGFARSFSGEPPAVDPRVRNWSVWSSHRWLSIATRRARCFISSPEVVMRREALREAGDYNPELPHSGDLDMWLRTALHWDIGRVNGPAQALYRVHDANMHLTTYAGMITDLRERRRTFELLFTEHAPTRTDVLAWRATAYRSLAREAIRLARATRHAGGDPALVTEYLDFAVETSPSAATRWARRRISNAAAVTEPGPVQHLHRFVARVRHHLAWRFERRYGT